MDLVLLYHIPLPCSKKAQQPDQQSWEKERRSDGNIAQPSSSESINLGPKQSCNLLSGFSTCGQ